MRILVTATHVPFAEGGAERHIAGLVAALKTAGHQVEAMRFPFRFQPETDVERVMRFCEGTDLNAPNGQAVDRVVSLQFPGWGVQHDDQVAWIMHQHRAVYELYDPDTADPALSRLRETVHAFDARTLARTRARFANSARVAERLRAYTDLDATPLYHPPPAPASFYTGEALDYVFVPSRLERLKRQDLFIEAARQVRAPVAFVIAGDGGQAGTYRQMIEAAGVGDRVHLIGAVSEAEKRAWYANALAVGFVPYDEDYGYVTLEAMLARKPVITCTDSGGPLEFVHDGETGRVVAPTAAAVARAVDERHADKARARRMGAAGRAVYDESGIGWERVVAALTA